MKTITLNGTEYGLGFDFSTVLTFEEQFNQPWEEMFKEQNLRKHLQIVYCSIYSNNEGAPDWKTFVKAITPADVRDAYNEVSAMMAAFFAIPDIMKGEEQKGEESQKNV